jgi:hypothetical protein
VKSLCSEFDIEIIPGNVYPLPGQTRAPASIRRLIDKHGAEHARLVLCILAEGKGNHALIDEMSLSAISDLLLACPDVVEGSTSDLLELFDDLPLGPYMAIANELRGVVHQGHALAGMLYLHVRRLREGSLAAREASRGKVDHANLSEIEKGRAAFRKGAHRTVKEKTEIGRQLLAKKAALPRGHFGPWLRESGLSDQMAHQCMRLAKGERQQSECEPDLPVAVQ